MDEIASPHEHGLKVSTNIFRGALAVSVAANAVGGYVAESELHPIATAVVHGSIPLLLAAGETLLVKVPSTGSGVADKIGYTLTGVVAAATMALSAANLAHLGVITGFGSVPFFEWLIPIGVDGLMVAAMIKVVRASKALQRETVSTDDCVQTVIPVENVVEQVQPIREPLIKEPLVAEPLFTDDASENLRLEEVLPEVLQQNPGITQVKTVELIKQKYMGIPISKTTLKKQEAWRNRKQLAGWA